MLVLVVLVLLVLVLVLPALVVDGVVQQCPGLTREGEE